MSASSLHSIPCQPETCVHICFHGNLEVHGEGGTLSHVCLLVSHWKGFGDIIIKTVLHVLEARGIVGQTALCSHFHSLGQNQVVLFQRGYLGLVAQWNVFKYSLFCFVFSQS